MPQLAMTGSREQKSLVFYADDQRLLLTTSLAEIVVDMCLAKLDHDEGFATATALDICRLRKRLDSVRAGLGMKLIQHGLGDEYRLTIPPEEMPNEVLLTECFFQLVERKVVTQEQADILRKHLRVIPHAQYKAEIKARGDEIEKKSQ